MENSGAITLGDWDAEYDLIIMGAGPGGMCTALVAALEGLRPLLIEKSDQVGGTGATSAGTIWIPGNRPSLAAGFDDDAKKAATYLDQLIGVPDETGLRQAYLDTGPEVVDYLNDRTDVRFVPIGKHPDYRDMEGAAVYGRALGPAMFDGRKLGRDFKHLRWPIPEFLVLGGMMVSRVDFPHLVNRYRSLESFAYSAKLALRYMTDLLRYPRGTRLVMGNALVARLYYSLKNQGVPVWLTSRVSEILWEDGAVIGAVVTSEEGARRIRAPKGVVSATGGFGHNRKMREDFMPTPTPPHSMAFASNTGDGLELLLQNGGAIAPEPARTGGLWAPVSLVRRSDGSLGRYPHLVLDRAKPGLIAVNASGRRFVNEAASYHDFVQAMYAANARLNKISAHLICEASFVTKYGLGNVHPGTTRLDRFEKEDYLKTATTLEELAQKIGVDAQTLRGTVERYNALAREGRDQDFGKGDTELNRFNGDPDNRPNPCLKPIETAPFVALEVWPAEIATCTGVATNADAQVLDEHGQPLAGLYAAGNDMASVMLGTYPGPGSNIGPALVFGYRAAMHAAGKRAR